MSLEMVMKERDFEIAQVRDLVETAQTAAKVYDHNLRYYRNLTLLYTGSAMASSLFIETSRFLSGQDVTRDLSLVAWNCALSGFFGVLERDVNGAAAHGVDGRVASFLLGPVALAVSFTSARYGILGPGLESGSGTLTGVLLGGLAGLATSWQAWRVARRGEEIGVYSIFGAPLRKLFDGIVDFHEPAIYQLRESYSERMKKGF